MLKPLIFLLITGCAHRNSPPSSEEALVSVKTSIDQAQASYLLGCVEGQKKLKVPLTFNGCRDMSLIHRQELESILGVSP
jgi:hypothetical protein